MRELKILEEMEQYRRRAVENGDFNVAAAHEKDMNIISEHMNDGWVSVEERLPDESLNSVIGWDEYRERCCFVQYYGGKWSLRADREPIKIIAWRPLPEPYRPERSAE